MLDAPLLRPHRQLNWIKLDVRTHADVRQLACLDPPVNRVRVVAENLCRLRYCHQSTPRLEHCNQIDIKPLKAYFCRFSLL